MEKLIVMIIIAIFWSIWKVIENANVPANKPAATKTRNVSSRQSLQAELEKFLKDASAEQDQNQNQSGEYNSRSNPYDDNMVVEEKPRNPEYYVEKRQKKKQQKKQSNNKNSKSQQTAKTVASKSPVTDSVSAHVDQYLGNKLDGTVVEHISQYLKPFESNITHQAPKALMSGYNSDGSVKSTTTLIPSVTPEQISKMLHDSNSIKNAVLLSEVLKRPDFSKFIKSANNSSTPRS